MLVKGSAIYDGISTLTPMSSGPGSISIPLLFAKHVNYVAPLLP